MAEGPWNAHISYLEDEVKKLDERADKLEKMIPDLKDAQKKHVSRQLVNHLREEARHYRKYLTVMKHVVIGAKS